MITFGHPPILSSLVEIALMVVLRWGSEIYSL